MANLSYLKPFTSEELKEKRRKIEEGVKFGARRDLPADPEACVAALAFQSLTPVILVTKMGHVEEYF